jgi:hypothetical protein
MQIASQIFPFFEIPNWAIRLVILQQFAEIQARIGNTDEALSAIRQLLDLSAGLMMSPAPLRLDPAWDPIRGDPRFQKLLTESSAKEQAKVR